MPAPKGNKNAVGNKGGAPTKYKSEYTAQAYKLCLLGCTDQQLADFFTVDVGTIHNWKKEHIEFFNALKSGKESADAEVAVSLYKRANGYSHADVDIKVINNKIVKTKLVKHYPPDTVAGIFWLKNRRPKEWRDKVEHGFTDKDGNDVVTVFEIPNNGRSNKKDSTAGRVSDDSPEQSG